MIPGLKETICKKTSVGRKTQQRLFAVGESGARLVHEEVPDARGLDPGDVGGGAGEDAGLVLHGAADGAEAHHAVNLPAVVPLLAQQRTSGVALGEEEVEEAAGGPSVSLNPAQIMESRTRSPQNFFCLQVLKSMMGRRAWFRASARDTSSFPPEVEDLVLRLSPRVERVCSCRQRCLAQQQRQQQREEEEQRRSRYSHQVIFASAVDFRERKNVKGQVFNVYFSVVKSWLSRHIWLFRLVSSQLIEQLIDAPCRQRAWQPQRAVQPRHVILSVRVA
ncbi:hypothetical protein EYF80_037086 [Liparis tanakae]|uniref:Uncharacterized protein n=1 Tax=Liparis tanakae TaxID=230148 RepID=A0A4Z2GGU7_9TELE|nr:hypothetical protein EYF80_037086 [Liparis tanakae]